MVATMPKPLSGLLHDCAHRKMVGREGISPLVRDVRARPRIYRQTLVSGGVVVIGSLTKLIGIDDLKTLDEDEVDAIARLRLQGLNL